MALVTIFLQTFHTSVHVCTINMQFVNIQCLCPQCQVPRPYHVILPVPIVRTSVIFQLIICIFVFIDPTFLLVFFFLFFFYRARQHAKNVSWLRRTEYISTEFARSHGSSESAETKYVRRSLFTLNLLLFSSLTVTGSLVPKPSPFLLFYLHP